MESTKILIVDDKQENILALKNLIKGTSLSILSAHNGEDALSLILDHDFALALLDVQMPDMSGIELARIMRSTRRSRNIPIIFVTAIASSKEIIFEGYDHGAVDFLVKPLDPHIVRSKVRVFVELDQQKKMMSRQMEQLNLLKSQAEQMSKTKSQFLANMSHEIRTPLGAILGFAEMLSDTVRGEEEQSEFVDAILRNGQLLKQLIDDILDISKIEAGRLVIEKRDSDFREIMMEIRQTFIPIAKARGLELLFRNSTEMPKSIVTDPVRLKQILINIIGNSLKFTTKGHVVVDSAFTRRTVAGEEKPQVSITIKDTGCGIPEETRASLFEPFVQADASTTRLYGGTGLGLSISRHLAQCLGGDVQLTSSISGYGSVFQITIDPEKVSFGVEDPSAIEKKATSIAEILKKSPHMRLNGLRILVVDDMADNLLLMRHMLTMAGALITCADSGEKCIEILKKGPFDAVLMDIQMPGLDGHTATRIIREMGHKLPIIAVTAHMLEEHRAESFRSGCDDHLTKPVDYGNLIRTITFHISSKKRTGGVAPAKETPEQTATTRSKRDFEKSGSDAQADAFG